MVEGMSVSGHDLLTVPMVDILGKIHVELVGMREALNGTNARLDTTNAELAAFKAEVRNELSGLRVDVHAGLDEVRREVHDLRTELREDLGARVRRLEEAVFKRAS